MFVFIERLIFFLIALSAIRSVAIFVQRLWNSMSPRAVARRSNAPVTREGATLLQQDPVCGTYVAGDRSLKRIVRGKVIHFCSAQCRDRYQAG